jgi:polyferredoxin
MMAIHSITPGILTLLLSLSAWAANTETPSESMTQHHHMDMVEMDMNATAPAEQDRATAPPPVDAHAQHIHDHSMATHEVNPAAETIHTQGGMEGHTEDSAHAGHQQGSDHQHPGLPIRYVGLDVLLMSGILLWALFAPAPENTTTKTLNLAAVPGLGRLVRLLNRSPWPLVSIKILSVSVFLLVVYAGLFGTALPERNLATTFVWNLWWPLVVVSVFLLGSAWCGICPWDTLASWLVRRRLWQRVIPHPGLNRKVPAVLRNIWPALLMFMGLTWLELGVGVTKIPQATALMALLMVILATASLLIFERKAFCRYFCPVGRTLGLYSRLAPIEIRSQNQNICADCKTLECYNGSPQIEPCPTHLTIGRFSQNTYCLSCGNCILSCPHQNVSWRLRSLGSEARSDARPMWDSTWFMLALMGITSFHGITMMPFWQEGVGRFSHWLGETGTPIWSFTLGMWLGFLWPVAIYALAITVTQRIATPRTDFKRLFIGLPFVTLPLAFAYHLAHNLDHAYRESSGMIGLFANPLGLGLSPLSAAERHLRMTSDGAMAGEVLFIIQASLMALGVGLAVQILRYRGRGLLAGGGHLTGWMLAPMLGFIATFSGFNLWLMAQEMGMRF